MKKLFIFISCLSLSLSCWAQTYKYIDKNGNTVFTDTPPKNEASIDSLEAVDTPTSQNLIENPENQIDINTNYMEQMKKDQDKKEQQAQKQQELKQTAWKKLKTAEKLLENAKLIRPGDFYPNAKGAGGRHTPQYKDRIIAAERNLNNAQNE